jgi:hypothetical protein
VHARRQRLPAASANQSFQEPRLSAGAFQALHLGTFSFPLVSAISRAGELRSKTVTVAPFIAR